jgi:hypothetical protein
MPELWIAGTLWMMDASINISMEPSVPLWETIYLKTAHVRVLPCKVFHWFAVVGSLLPYILPMLWVQLKELSLTL